MSLDAALEIFIPIAQAVAYAHRQGVVHRDLKPSNVILSPDRSDAAAFIPKIVDFGVAKIREADESRAMALTATGDVFGTPLYISPEQCAGTGVDARSDIYSMGCMLFESLTGTPPFNDSKRITLSGQPVEIQPAAEKLILKTGYCMGQWPNTWVRYRHDDLFGIVIDSNLCECNQSTISTIGETLLQQHDLNILSLRTLTFSPKSLKA